MTYKPEEATVFHGDNEILVRYDYDKGEPMRWNGLTGVGTPEIPPSIEVCEVLYRGHWTPASHFSPAEHADWEQQIMDQLIEKQLEDGPPDWREGCSGDY